MRLTILGSSGGYPGPENPTSGFLVKSAATALWIDAGHGTFSALQRVEDFTRIDAVVVSHVHADHCTDLYALNIALRFHEDGVLRKRLYCPLEVWERMPLLLGGSAEAQEGFRSTFDFQPVEDGGEIEVGGVRIRFARTDHPNYCLAMRLESGDGILTYSADTGPGTDLTRIARDADLFLCEACYQEDFQGAPVHLTARQAGDIARRAGVRDLAVTHLWPTLAPEVSLAEARQTAGDVRVALARAGGVFEVG